MRINQREQWPMLRGDSTLRLTRTELARWTKITGCTPYHVRSEVDLERFAAGCKNHFRGTSKDARFIHALIDEELRRNFSNQPMDVHGDRVEQREGPR